MRARLAVLLLGAVVIAGCQRMAAPVAAPASAPPPAVAPPANALSTGGAEAEVDESRAAWDRLDADCWGRRLRAFKEPFCPVDAEPRPKFEDALRDAKKALFHDGRGKARQGLRQLLARTGPDDPEHFWAAFALAYLDLDYARGRDLMLRDIRASGPAGEGELSAERRHWDDQSLFMDDPANAPFWLVTVYDRHPDPVVPRELLAAMTWAQDRYWQELAGACGHLAIRHPRAFLAALKGVNPIVGEATCADMWGTEGYEAGKIRRALQSQARGGGPEVASTARQALRWFNDNDQETKTAHRRLEEYRRARAGR